MKPTGEGHITAAMLDMAIDKYVSETDSNPTEIRLTRKQFTGICEDVQPRFYRTDGNSRIGIQYRDIPVIVTD